MIYLACLVPLLFCVCWHLYDKSVQLENYCTSLEERITELEDHCGIEHKEENEDEEDCE